MRIRFWLFALLVLPLYAFAQNAVHIEEVGLKGYYASGLVTPVQVEIAPLPSAQTVQLEFTGSNQPTENYEPLRTDHFSMPAAVKANETTRVDVPLFLPTRAPSTLSVTLKDASGHPLGSSSVKASSLSTLGTDYLLVILCKGQPHCEAAQSQISFGGSPDDVSEKNKRLRFVSLESPREHWWDYRAATVIVLDSPVAAWSEAQRLAVEFYLRRGGSIILVEDDVNDRSFLAAYRRRPLPAGDPVPVGHGKLYRVASLNGGSLNPFFSGGPLKQFLEHGLGGSPATSWLPASADVGWLRQRVGVSFDFPRLRWLVIWLAIYLIVVGFLNFTLLRRWRRLEWGWVTVTGIALGFAAAMYVASSANRPKQMTLDAVTVYTMDSASAIAVENIGIRVSTPERTSVAVSAGDDAIVSGGGRGSGESNADIATEITENRRIEPGWDLRLGPPLEMDLPLVRWSFADLDFTTFRKFSGSVIMTSPTRLRNDTGLQFQEAEYFDFPSNLKYRLPALAPGQEVDLASIEGKEIYKKTDSNTVGDFRVRALLGEKKKGPFSIDEIPYGGMSPGPGHRIFVGQSDAPVPAVQVSASAISHHNVVITMVNLDQP